MPDGVANNQLLAALPKAGLKRIVPYLEPVELHADQVIYCLETPIETSYFLTRGLVSLVKRMRDGRTVEIGAIGTEGVTGPDALFGIRDALFECIVRVPGTALSIRTDLLRQEVERSEAARTLMARFVQAIIGQIAQTAACSRIHAMEQRCSRWLLIAHDGVGSDTFPVTHEFLATLLGVQRAGITLRLNALQDRGLIRISRGQVTIVNRRGLESESCECYGVIRKQLNRIFADPS